MKKRRPHTRIAVLLLPLCWGCGEETLAPAPPRIAFVTILPVATTLAPGDTLTLSAIPRDSTGAAIGPRPVTWNSTAPAIVRIDSTGLASAIAPGAAEVLAIVDGIEGRASIVVAAPVIATRFLAVSAGGHHTCAIGVPTVVLCWGRNKDGQVGDGTYNTSGRPSAVQLEGVMTEIATGARHSCVLAETGTVSCWGWNASGQVGAHIGEDKRLTRPTPIDAPGPFVRLVAGNAHNCTLAADGAATCWGSDEIGQLGDGAGAGDGRPRADAFIEIDAGHAHTCGVHANGGVSCWGWNAYGQLGASAVVTECAQNVPCAEVPQHVTGVPPLRAVSAGFGFTCGLTRDGAAYCWGLGVEGQLGAGSPTSSTSPMRVAGDLRFVAMEAGAAHVCAIAEGGEAWCWGANRSGQLGDGTRAIRSSPVRVTGIDRPVAALSAGESHSCAILDDGRLVCWGSAGDGRLGPYAR